MKEIFLQLYRLVRHPQREWRRIADDKQSLSELRNVYILPLMEIFIVVTLISNFIGFTKDASDAVTTEHILKICCKELVTCISSIFIGFHLAVLILNSKLTSKLFHARPDYSSCARLVAYSLSLYMIVKTLITLFSLFVFLYATLFYLIYIIWYSIPSIFPDLEKEKYSKFSIYATIIICGAPILMENLMKFIMKN